MTMRKQTKRTYALFALAGVAVATRLSVAFGADAATRTLTLEAYRDKMKGAWVGQMVGVSWGQPTEFRWNDKIIPAADVPKWTSDFPLKWAYGNDDLYVEMTFLKTLEDHGLDVSIRQAGIDFANSGYPLWCANLAGRNNLRQGIAPPDCSHPAFNRCPNDIDYQIEADYAGIIAPGCPQEAIRLGNLFGRLMNYGDGVWAGQFIGAVYAEAFFTSDVGRLLDAGLAAIPSQSDYAQMVRNVRAWHREAPADWTACWQKIRTAYSKRHNAALKGSNGDIDVRLNGACIILGLLYGNGDLDKSMELAMRCGWDSDCNPANVGGILMTVCGFKALPAKYVEKLDYARTFSHTAYNLPSLFAASEKLARQVVVRHGGRVETGADGVERFVIPVKAPVPDAWTPSWNPSAPTDARYTEAEMARIRKDVRLPRVEGQDSPDPTVRVQKALDALAPGWKTSKNAPDMQPGFISELHTAEGPVAACVRTHPPCRGEAVVLSRTLTVPAGNPTLHFEVANAARGNFRLVVRVNGCPLLATIIGGGANDARVVFRAFDLSLEPWAGKNVGIELVNEPTGWMNEAAVWRDIRITANSGASN